MTADGRERLAWALGIAVFFAVYLPLEHLIPEAHCADGWESPSIGSRGACSHHGGVVRYGGGRLLAWITGGAVAFFVGRLPLPKPPPPEPSVDELVRRAIAEKKRLAFFYRAKGQQDFTERVIRPEAITFEGYRSAMCVTGFCELKREERTFRVSRMSRARVLDS